jgi:DNA-binding CsgD family transcriptional regulator/tetratricopeptide (TPR) repeat protein
VVGRADELRRVDDALRDASGGASGALFVVGDAGIGKTRVVTEVAGTAARMGLPVLAGRASAVAPATFGLVAEALRSWLRTQPGHHSAAEPDVFDDGLRLVVPEWRGRETSERLSDNQLRLLAFEAVVRLVRDIAAPRGALIVFDDLHYADADSIEVIRYLVNAAPPGAVVLGALRGSEGIVANEMVTALAAAGAADVVTLGALDRDAIADLLTVLLQGRPPALLIDDIAARTDGVPLLVEEVLDAHVRNGSVLCDDAGVHWRGGATAVPHTVVTTVARRLDRLSPAQRSVIVAGAVLGDFDVQLLGAVAQEPPAVVHDALVHGVEQGLLETVAGRLEFHHAVLRDATIEGALPHVVAAMHARAATALADRDDPDVGTFERRARHLDAVGQGDAAADLLTAASTRSLGQRGLFDAERLARAALERAHEQAAVDRARDALAAALAAQGRWTDALDLDEATTAHAGHDRARWLRMAQCALDARLNERTRALLADARASDEDNYFVHVTMGRLALNGGDTGTAFTCAARALELASDDPLGRCAALDLQARALEIDGQRRESIDAYTTLVDEARAGGLVDVHLRALVCLSEFELFEGQPPERMFEARDLARESGALVEQAWAELNLAIALLLQGNPRAGYDVIAPAVERVRQLRLALLPFVLVARAGAESYLGIGDYEATLAEGRALAEGANDFEIHAGGIHSEALTRAGRYDEAVEVIQRGVDAVRANPGGVPSDGAFWLVFVLMAAGRPDDAARALELAPSMPGADRWYANDVLLEGATAIVALDADRMDAVLHSDRAGMPFELARMRLVAADVIGGPRRAQWLREALDVFEAAECGPTADRVRQLLRDAGGAVPRGRSRGRVPPALIPFGVTAREAEVLALVAAGASNADTAAQLFISVRTVESHVSSLLTKLRVDSRDDLAAWAGA